jgi:hypothetical protein
MAKSVSDDPFDELPALKRDATSQATRLGHALTRFRRFPNDRAQARSYCSRCYKVVVINCNIDALRPPAISGPAVVLPCPVNHPVQGS